MARESIMFTQETYDRGDAIMFSWHIDDVKSVLEQAEDYDPNNTLTDEECREILRNFERHHDGSMIAMWEDLEYHVNEFKEEKENE